MKKILMLLFTVFLLATAIVIITSTPARAYNANHLMDDEVFDQSSSLSVADIQNWLNTFPNSCIKNTYDVYPIDYFNYGSVVSSATVISRAAQLWGINPRVILAKLEQEEGLVTGGAGCAGWRYNSAMGMGCPDSGPCPSPGYEGFSRQVTKGSWQLKWSKEVSVGNVNWQGNGDITYGGKMTAGTRKRCNSCSAIPFSGYYVMDGVGAQMETGATASLYTYTPHIPSSFPVIYENFFGVGSTSAFPPWVVFRAFNKYNGKHLYTMDVNEWKNSPKFGYVQENYVFIQYPSTTNVALWRLNKPQKQKYFYTTSYPEADYAARRLGYIIEGVAFNVEPAAKVGLKPVYRVYNPYIDDHLYTQSVAEKDQALTQKSYIYEGIAWYTY